MKLQSSPENIFALEIRDYQFPNCANIEYDADWLVVEVRITRSQGSWKKAEPCMLTWELANLAEWFRKLGENEEATSSIEFMEPELRFEAEGRSLKIFLKYGLIPPWTFLEDDSASGDEVFVMEFRLDHLNLESVIRQLDEMVNKFPVRVPV